MAARITWDSAALAAMLHQSGVVSATAAAADGVAARAGHTTSSGTEIPVTVSPIELRVSGRARPAFAVRLAHPAGAAVEAKHGPLHKAARAAGLRVK